MSLLMEDIEIEERNESLYLNDCVNPFLIDDRVKNTLPYTLVSSSLSVVGSLLIIILFLAWKDMRSSNTRKMIFLIAVADLFTAASFISAVTKHYTFLHQLHPGETVTVEIRKNNSDYGRFCEAQAFLTVYFQCVSFFLTSFLAVYFVIILVFKKLKLARKLILPFCLTSWTMPIITCGYVLSHRRFGISDSRSSVGWCFIDNSFLHKNTRKVVMFFLWELLAQKLWEISAFFIIIACYCCILFASRCRSIYKCRIKRSVHSTEKESMIDSDDEGQWDSRQTQKAKAKTSTPVKGISDVQKAILKTDWRLALVPLVFLLFRFWGNLRFFVSMTRDCCVGVVETEELNGFFCITEGCFDVLYNEVILALHAFGDPAQGFGNAILFVFLSKNIMKRLLAPILNLNIRKKSATIQSTAKPSRAAIIVTYRAKKQKAECSKEKE